MKSSDIRGLSESEIRNEVSKRREELLDLRFQSAIGQAANPRRIRTAKREIARLLTIAREMSGDSK
jgi:large subunit ribosomal protein L29